jgi:hypothetical protein
MMRKKFSVQTLPEVARERATVGEIRQVLAARASR